MKKDEILEDIIRKICKRMNMQLYDWKLKGTSNNQSLVIFITRKNGITLEDCQMVSKEIGDELDMRDIFDSRYILEVSSPGLNRFLKSPDHFMNAVDESVKIKYQNNEQKIQVVKGLITSANEDSVLITLDEEKIAKIFYKQIKSAKTIFNWTSEFYKKTNKRIRERDGI